MFNWDVVLAIIIIITIVGSIGYAAGVAIAWLFGITKP